MSTILPKKKTVFITGVCGQQGTSVAKALADFPDEFILKGFTRDAQSEKATALKTSIPSLQFVEGKGLDSTEEELTAAFTGVDILFLTTNYWDPRHPNELAEMKEGQTAISAAKKAGVKHVVLSALENSFKLSKGSIKSPYFDGKAATADTLKKSGLAWTVIEVPTFFENFLTLYPPSKDCCLTIPMDGKSMESMSVEDLGPAVHYILSRCEEFKNKTLSISAEKLTLHEYAKTLSKAMGKKIKYQPMTEEEYGKQTGDEKNMLQMFRFMKNFPLKRDHALLTKLNPATQTFTHWCEAHKECLKALIPEAETAKTPVQPASSSK